MKKLVLMFSLLLFSPVYSQDEINPLTSSIPVRSWNEFQETQEQIKAEQVRLFGEITKIRETVQEIRQFNLNILAWQDANQQAASGEIPCGFFKTKYDPRIEWTVMALALVGAYLLINNFLGLFKKKEQPKENGV